MQLDKLLTMSHKYGSDEDYVLAGGGNTSYKENGVMAVKASGTILATIDEAGFVFMDTGKLIGLLNNVYPKDDSKREALVLQDMMAARLVDQGEKRPSVESVLHALFEQAYVLHLHPAMVNGMTCGRQGAKHCERLFSEEALWIPLAKPGFILSKVCSERFLEYKNQHKRPVDIVFLQNHGLFVAGDTIEEIDAKMEKVMRRVADCIDRKPDSSDYYPEHIDMDDDIETAVADDWVKIRTVNKEVANYAEDDKTMAVLMNPFTPDHIVYCKDQPLYVKDKKQTKQLFDSYVADKAYQPRIIVVKDSGLYACGESIKVAETALKVFVDGVRIAVYSESFGGPLGLDAEFTQFILNWEIESYRAKKSLNE